MVKNSFAGRRFGAAGQNNGGVGPGVPPPLTMSGAPGQVPLAGPSGVDPVGTTAPALPSSGLASNPSASIVGTAPSAYGTTPQDIVGAAYGGPRASDRAGATTEYGDLIRASGGGAQVPQGGTGASGASPALAPPLYRPGTGGPRGFRGNLE